MCKWSANSRPAHTGPEASRISDDEAGGQSVLHKGHVMLSANIWVELGLVNGALGSVVRICYAREHCPPDLPIAVTVKFDFYNGPTLADGTVPICPLQRTWFSTAKQCSHLQLPLRLAWAVTIHKSQGLTLDKVVIDVGKRVFFGFNFCCLLSRPPPLRLALCSHFSLPACAKS